MQQDREGVTIEDHLENRAKVAVKIFNSAKWATDCQNEAKLQNELNLVFIGPTGSGKSSTVNNILEHIQEN